MRKSCVVLSLFALIFLTLLTACGGGSRPIAVSITPPTSTTIPAGSSVALTAGVTNDSKNGGVSWALSPSTCGTLTNATTTTVTYTAPAAATLNADCTATITATSVSDTTKSTPLALTIKAISVTVAGAPAAALGAGAPAVTLTATLNNEATGATDAVTWSYSFTNSVAGIRKNAARPNVAPANCGTFASSGLTATYTPPSVLSGNCTATITAASTINSHQTSVTTITVDAVAVAITAPASAVTEFAHQGAVALTATVTNDGANKGLTWSLSNPACGAIAAGTPTTSATYTPPVAPAAACSTTVTATSVTDPIISATSPLITINPNIVVAWSGTVPTSASEGGTAALVATITNDVGGKGLSWAVSPVTGCGSLSAATGTNVTYTAPSPLAAACTATVTVSSVADISASVQTAIAVTPTAVSITAPTGAQSVASSAVVALTATIANDGSGKGIVWTISPATGCGTISATAGAAINYTAPTEANLPTACTATVSAAPVDDPTKTKSVSITANPISVSAITSTSGTLPLTVGQGSAAIPLSATISYDTGGGITWGVSQTGTCGTWGTAVVSGNTSTLSFTPAASIAGTANCVATITASSAVDSTKSASTTITVTPLTVTITTPATNPTTVADGTTQALVAAVAGDPANKGVAWSLSPATGCGSLTIPTLPTFAATYNAPATGTPACTVTVTATSVADNTKSTTTKINASPGISVGLSPAGSASIDANNPLSITATVAGDSAGKGVNLSLNPATGCGTLSAASASSGVAFSYNPPAALASTCTVSVVAASQSDGTKTATLGLTVYPALTLPATSTATLGAATVGEAYTGFLTAGGGPQTGAYTWTVTGMSDGLTSNAAGDFGSIVTIGGTPIAAQTVSFQVSVQDPTGMKVGPVTYSIVVNPYTAVALPSTGLPSATVSQSYNGAINAIGGIQTYTYTVNGTVVGSSPTLLNNGGGLSGSSSGGNTLFLTGTPTATGTITLNVSVVDGEGKTASAVYTISVNAVSTIVISASNLEIPQGMVTMPYGTNFDNNNAVSGGTQPYTYSFSGLPSWASSDINGNITGTPTASGQTSVTVTVQDSSSPQQSQTATFTLPVVPLTTGTNNSMISGQYACIIHQTYDTPTTVSGHNLYRGAIALAIAFDGNGNITGGEADSNNPVKGYENTTLNGNITGTYAVGADDRGYITLSKGNGKYNYLSLAAGTVYAGAFTEFRVAELDDVGTSPSGRHGGGLCFKQYDKTGTTTLNGQVLSGGYVFLQNGEDSGGSWETGVGSINITGGTATGVIDIASGSNVSLDQTFSGAVVSNADLWGRVTFTCSTNCGSSVLYITNQTLGQGVFLTTDSHSTGNDLLFGQFRAQSATAIAASYPITGPFVMYTSGLDNETGSTTKSMIDHGTGGTSAKTLTIDGSAQNDGGTLTLNSTDVLNQAMAYTVDTTTGRVSFGKSGDVMYIYNTNEAVVMLADTGTGGASSYQNLVGWLETQVTPTSGVWANATLVGNYFMGEMYDPGTNNDTDTGAFTVTSTGSMSPFAQDKGGQNSADWDEGISGGSSGAATGVVARDTTLDPNGTLGIFDINITQGTSTSTQVYCFAASVNTATKSTTWGRLICMDAASSSPKITIVAQ